MPRCFMAKKLKYPYEQWKQEQELRSSHGSRSPSPATVAAASAMEHLERSNELSASLAGSSESGQQQLGNSKSLYYCYTPLHAFFAR